MSGYLYEWTTANGGDVGAAANWSRLQNGASDGTIPGPNDEAEFANLGGTITGTITVGQWVIANGAGFYTFGGDTTASVFQVDASASLTGRWDATVTGNFLGLIVDSALISNGGAITTGAGIAIGYAGSGSLSETGGATLTAASIDLAAQTGTTGTLDLSGGSTANITAGVVIGGAGGSGAIVDIDASTLTAQDQVQVGLQSSGTLTLQDGGLLSTAASLAHPFLAVGGAGSYGLVDVNDGELDAGTNQIVIGDGGSANLTVQAGGALIAGSFYAANGGTVDVKGALTTVTIGTGGFGIGQGGTARLTLEQGATLTAAGQVEIGTDGAGTIAIDTGATLTSTGAAFGVLFNGPGTGTAILDAAHWLSSGQIEVGAGNGGTAELQLADGATLQATATLASGTPFLFVDENVANHASVDIGGAGTRLDAGGNSVVIGEAGFGVLSLHDGAELKAGGTGSQAAFVLGDQSGSTGTATLADAATEVDLTGGAIVGGSGAGSLTVAGTFSVGGNMDIAVNASATGVVNVNGAGSDLDVTGGLIIGGATTAGGIGSVALRSGAILTAAILEMFAAGTLTIDATSRAEIGGSGNAVAGQLLIDAGVTAGGSGRIAAAVDNQGDIVAQNGALTITGQASGEGTYDIAAGATLDLNDPRNANIRFDSATGAAVLGTASGTASLAGFTAQDSLDLIGIGAGATATYSGDSATITGATGSWIFDFAAAPPVLQITDDGADALVVACFAAGTSIATQGGAQEPGEVPVEALSVGDRVRTRTGELVPIKWIGHRHVDCRRHPRPEKVWPVRVRAGAFGDSLPHRALWLSPDHAVFADDVLIPIKCLINGTSIARYPMDEVTYYHIALRRHDVLFAEGLLVESYLDTGDRRDFANGGDTMRLFPDFSAEEQDVGFLWEALGYAPLVVAGPALEAVRRRLNARAEHMTQPRILDAAVRAAA